MPISQLFSIIPLDGKTLNDTSYINVGTSADATIVKSSPGTVYGYEAFNNSSSIAYLKLYDKATKPTTSDTPKRTILIPNNAGAGAGMVRANIHGLIFAAGISFRITTGISVNSSAAASSSTIIVNMDYL